MNSSRKNDPLFAADAALAVAEFERIVHEANVARRLLAD